MKKVIKLFIVFALLLVVVFFYPKARIYLTTNKFTTYNYDKRLRITYLMIDKEKTENMDITVSNAVYSDASISLVQNGIAYLNKEGDYYVGYINDVNDYILEDVPDYSFTYNNLNGEVIDGCTFDLKSRKIKIPTKYYENPRKDENVQMEIISRVDKEKFSSLKYNLKVSGLKNYEKKFTLNANEVTSLISIMDYNSKNSISKEDISIYVNDDADKLDTSFYEWNSADGTIELNLSPVLIKNVTVTIDSNIISYNLLGRVAADNTTEKFEMMNVAANLSGDPELKKGDTVKLNNVGVAYKAKDNKIYGQNEAKNNYENANADNDLYTNCVSDSESCSKYDEHSDYFVLNLSEISIGKSSIKANTFVKAYCGAHTETVSNENPTIDIILAVIAVKTEDNYLIVEIKGATDADNFYTQIPAGVIKLVWDESYGEIKVKKKYYDQGINTEIPKNEFAVSLYSDSSCSKKTQKQKYFTNETKTITFKNLALGTYSIKESKCDDKKYKCDNTCYKVTISKTDTKTTDSNDNTIYIDTTKSDAPLKNYKKYYCKKIEKIDAENKNCYISGVEFSLSSEKSKKSGTTNQSGVITFSYLDYEDYSLSEIATSSKLKVYCSKSTSSAKKFDGSYYYKIDDTPTNIPKGDLVEMVFDDNKKKYTTCSSESKVVIKIENQKKRYCIRVKKVDSNNTTNGLSGAEFEVVGDSDDIAGQYNSNGEKDVTITDGYAYFYTKFNSDSITIKETKTNEDYKLDSNEHTITPVELNIDDPDGLKNEEGTLDGKKLVKACNDAYANTDTTNITNTKEEDIYCVKIRKVDSSNETNGLSGAKFKVVGNYTGVSGQYNSEGENGVTTTDGYAYFYTQFNSKAMYFRESKAPNNYVLHAKKFSVTPQKLEVTRSELKNEEGTLDGKKLVKACNDVYNDNMVMNFKNEKKEKKRYCIKIKKVDETETALAGVKFKLTEESQDALKDDGVTIAVQYNSNGKNDVTTTDGYAYFYTGRLSKTIELEEAEVPLGYEKKSSVEVNPVKLNINDVGEIQKKDDNNKTILDVDKMIEKCNEAYMESTNETTQVKNSKYQINWYKIAEDKKTRLKGAKFIVKIEKDEKVYYVTASVSNSSNGEYTYTDITTDSAKATTFVSGDNGEVVIDKIANGKYTVEETVPAKYHTFGAKKSIKLTASTEKKDLDSKKYSNAFGNYPTEFEFTKKVEGQTTNEEISTAKNKKFNVNGQETNLYDLTTKELKDNLTFNIYEYDKEKNEIKSSTPLKFIIDDDGYYQLAESETGGTSNATSELKLNDNRKIKVKHLEWGKYYIIKEKAFSCGSESGCTGYYEPNYSNNGISDGVLFFINKCQSEDSKGACKDIFDNDETEYSVVKEKELINTPTEITFTKSDLFHDSTNNSAEFENESEVLAFDKIKFSLKEKGSNTSLSFIKVRDGVYRYVNGLSVSANSGNQNVVTELYTKDGTLTITNLCRGKTYVLTEEEVPADSVYSLVEKNKVEYTIPCKEPTDTKVVSKEIINTPTRYEIWKKDSYTGALIDVDNSKAGFKLYKCKDDTCANTTLVKFRKITIKNTTDQDNGKEVYAYYNAIEKGKNIETLSLIEGKLIFRYLPLGTYKLVETTSPDGFYTLSDNKITFNVVSPTLSGQSTFWDTPTQIEFTKKDIYSYYNVKEDSTDAAVFDSMKFKLRDKDGNVLKLKCVTVGSSGYNSNTKKCDSGKYRLIRFNTSDNDDNLMTEINTTNAKFIITNLKRATTYYIEETQADTSGHFILPTNRKYNGITWNNGHPVVTYKIDETTTASASTQNKNQTTPDSLTEIMENTPTRVLFRKIYIKNDGTKEVIKDEENPSLSGKTTFNVYKCETVSNGVCTQMGALIKFNKRGKITGDKEDSGKEVYKYAKNQNATGLVTDLNTYYGELILRYLPKGNYVLVEKNSPDGYFNPINPYTHFEVKGESANETKDFELTDEISNKPTKLIFNKEDLYNYYDSSDIASINNNIKLFDTMKFKLRDENGNVLKLKCTTKDGKGYNSKTKMCESGEYRYLPIKDDENTITELNTIDGTFTVTHLYKDKVYYVEEVKSDEEGVFILPDYMNFTGLPFDNKGHPVVKYTLPKTEPTNYKSVTEVIKNTPTRVRLEKRDSKYNYLIPDETTTFNVYRCEKGIKNCTKDQGELVYFTERALINGDTEDSGVEVYKYSKLNAKAVSDLHPYNGVLVLRYLPSNYSYVIVETVAPKNYSLPIGSDAETQFTVESNTVNTDIVDVANKPTSLIIKKYADDSSTLLAGAEFRIYEGTKCDSSLSAMNQPKTLLKLKTIRDGVYENRPNTDTDTIKTCKDKEGALCSDITSELTYEKYQNTFADFNTSLNEENERVSIKEGEALVQYLEYGHCYIIEEVKAPKGYSLPEKDEDRFTMVQIEENTTYVADTYKTFINKPTPFTFYKYDEYNQLLDGAEFKLQKLNDEKKYEDLTVTKEETESGVFYKVDSTTDNKTITTVNGSATVYYLEEGQYRIVETKPAEGKEINKNPNIATFFVDENGKVYGNSIIVNKAKTETVEVKSSASAELVVAVRTGVTVVRYGLIIAGITGAIIALMALLRIKKSKSE